uniref:Molecular chaperone TorD n=1 Tax=Muribaculaceae bacterium Z82 TaxID=2304548 RepID=A0A7C9NU27_9BACT
MGFSECDAELLVARFYAYKLFHVVLSAEPTDEVMDALLSDNALDAAAVLTEGGYDVSLLVAAVEELRARRAAEPDFVAAAHKAFNQLFLVPGGKSVKLYESVYAGQMNTIFGETTIDMRRYLREAGLASDAEGNFPEDCLPLMLDFMAALAQRSWEAAQAGDDACAGEPAVDTPAGTGDDAFAAGLRVQKAFADEHLGAWLGSVVASLDAHDASRIYFALGQAMEQFVESDKRWLSAACA